MSDKQYDIQYICTHLGEEDAASTNFGAVAPPIFETSLHVFESIGDLLAFDIAAPGGKFLYGRVDNPTTRLLETKLAALEHADGALCFASGMGAISAAILHCVRPGDHVVTLKNVYGPARAFLSEYLKHRGVEVTFVAGTDPADFERAIQTNTRMFYLESPTSCMLELQDLRALAAIAKQRGIATAIDNTWATPIHQRPLEFGIDIVVHTMSKYIGGHSDIIGGVLCARQEIIDQVKTNERELLGGILGPFEAWLAIRGLRTMPLRVKQSGENALAVARYLEAHPKVVCVCYPGVESYPQRALAKSQMGGSTGLLSFELDVAPERAIEVCDRLTLFRKGVSWGGFESLCCMPMFKYTDEQVADRGGARNLIRLYCGIEDGAALLQDVEDALKHLA